MQPLRPQRARPIPLTRMDRDNPRLMEQLVGSIARVASTGRFVLGEEVDRFEHEFANYCDARHAIGVASGTDALALALRALGIGPGDEVVVPANSFVASAEAVSLVGATPRFADVDPFAYTVTAGTIASAVSPRTAAIIVVHLFGRTVDLEPIMHLAEPNGIAVVEDACQAHGAVYNRQRVGAIGDVGCFSFYPSKNLGAWGDGGAVTTNDDALADRVRLLRSHGERPRYHHRLAGTTSRLDSIQAAVLRVKLRLLDEWNDARRALAARLTGELAELPISTPIPPAPQLDHVFHQYVIRTPQRDLLREHLQQRGIATGIHYPVPLHQTEAYGGADNPRLPVSERLAGEICSLPMHPEMTDADFEAVVDAVRSFAWETAATQERVAL